MKRIVSLVIAGLCFTAPAESKPVPAMACVCDDGKVIDSVPSGMFHDFGKLKHGIIARRAVSIVNISDAPIQIVTVRISSARCLSAKMSKSQLQPKEEAKLELTLYTEDFIQRKTVTIYITIQSGDKLVESRFLMQAESINESHRTNAASEPSKTK